MNRKGNGNGLPHDTRKGVRAATPFLGFTPLDANFLYCPNQFLDLCLPFHSRGCVRLVSYLFRKTLGWRDEFGRPLQQRIPVPYQQLIEHAGISRGAIRDAIDEAVKSRFIRCTLEGNANTAGKAAQSSSYELRWDHGSEFAKSMTEFNGFFAGDGHRTPIPNDFFDVVVPCESLAITRVVGAIIRKTIGYQDQFGGRRAAAPMSFTELQRRSNIADRKTISQAVHAAIDSNYIVLVREGTFDPSGGERNMAAAYGIKWSEGQAAATRNGSKTPPAPQRPSVQKTHRARPGPSADASSGFSDDLAIDGSFSPPASRVPNGSKTPPVIATVQKPHRAQSKNPTGNGTKTPLLERVSERGLSKEQQQQAVADESLSLLKEIGFDVKAARQLAAAAPLDVIRQQVEWLERRTATRNKLGLLRQAVLENWPEPQSSVRTSEVENSPAALFASGFYAGIGNNNGKSVAEPSANDLAAAKRFFERSGGLVAADQAESSGRLFGSLVREWRGTATAVNSLVASLRSFGDKFAARLESQSKNARVAQATQQAEKQLARQKQAYQEYLLAFEQVVRRTRTEDMKRFDAWREKERERFASMKVGSKHMLAYFESDERRLQDLASFFDRDVLGFKAWQQKQKQGEELCVSSP